MKKIALFLAFFLSILFSLPITAQNKKDSKQNDKITFVYGENDRILSVLVDNHLFSINGKHIQVYEYDLSTRKYRKLKKINWKKETGAVYSFESHFEDVKYITSISMGKGAVLAVFTDKDKNIEIIDSISLWENNQ